MFTIRLCSLLFIGILQQEVNAPETLKMQADFSGIHFEKLVFYDNTSLLDDITFVDRLVADFQAIPIITEPDQLLLSIPNNLTGPLDFQFQIDILMVADYSMYRKFIEIYRNNTKSSYIALREYLEAIFEQVSTIYQRLRFFENKQITLRLVDAIPIIRSEDCPLRSAPQQFNTTFDVEEGASMSNFTDVPENGGIEALVALHSITNWIREYSDLLPKHDHALVITARDLLSQRNESSTQGLAYVRAMCRGPDSASIIEDVGGLTTSAISAHEIIHSLGAFHDGSGNSSECPGNFNYLMSPSTSGNENNDRFGNSFLLSQCSIEQVEEFLNSSDANCLKKPKPVKYTNSRKNSNEQSTIKMGERFDRTQQCKIAFGIEYGVCTSRDFPLRWSGDLCRRLWCKNRQSHRFNSCETKAYLPLMDGTDCGTNKCCKSGACVQRSQNLQNDCTDVHKNYCRKFAIEPRRKACISRHIRQICCQTCKSYAPNQNNAKKRIKSDL